MDTGKSIAHRLPFTLHRKQFPVVGLFAVIVNQKQGQRFDTVGIYKDKPWFSHDTYMFLYR